MRLPIDYNQDFTFDGASPAQNQGRIVAFEEGEAEWTKKKM